MNLFMIGLLGYSIFWLLNHSFLFKKIKDKICNAVVEPDGLTYKIYKPYPILSELYTCSYCISFWTAMIFFMVSGHGLLSIPLSLICAIISYFLYLLEKNLIKNL